MVDYSLRVRGVVRRLVRYSRFTKSVVILQSNIAILQKSLVRKNQDQTVEKQMFTTVILLNKFNFYSRVISQYYKRTLNQNVSISPNVTNSRSSGNPDEKFL